MFKLNNNKQNACKQKYLHHDSERIKFFLQLKPVFLNIFFLHQTLQHTSIHSLEDRRELRELVSRNIKKEEKPVAAIIYYIIKHIIPINSSKQASQV